MINLTMLLPMTTQRASKNHRFIYNGSSDSNCCSVTMTAAVRTKTKRKILLSAILIALSTLSFFLVLLDDDGNYNLGFFSSYYYSQHLNHFNKYHKRHHRQRDRQLQAKYIDYRQECIKAITKTPGHDLFNSNDGVPIQKKVHRPLGKMYVYSPRKEYEVMRDEKYGGCDRCLPFPMPYQTMLHPETMRKLGLPSIDEQEVLHRGSSPGSKIVANAAEKSSTDSNTHQTHRSMFPRPYTTTQAINTLSRFQSEAFLLRYSSNRDEFHFYVRRSQLWNVHLAHHARAVEETLIPILRRDHGQRFRKTSQGGRDFAVVISTGDNPKVSCNCMSVPSNREELPKWLEKDFAFVPSSGGGNGKGRCNRYEFSPIWQFGSGFVNPDVMPSMVTFPPWSEHHLGCFRSYRFEDRVCDAFLERSDRNPGGIYFGMHELEIGLGGEDDDGNEVEDSEGAEEIGKNYNGDVAADMAPPEQEVATSQERMRRALQQVPKGGGDTSNPKDLDRNKVPVVYYDRQRRQLVERASELTSTVAFPNNGKSNIITIPIFNYLKPQIIWRGTDFSFLNCLASGHHYFHLTPDQAVYGPTDPAVFDAAGAAIPDEETIGTAPSTPIAHQRKSFIDGLFQSWGSLTPRWKAVTLSLEAEMIAEKVNQELNTLNEQISLQHQRKDDANSASSTDMRAAFSFPKPRTQIHEALPWIDAKFTDKQRTPSETNRWIEFHEQDGHIVGGHMSWKEASSYKYHVDIGGGGGTTWQGTLSKLALPGVLFHHETPTFDWFHEDLLPWVHYIPISTELPDLEEKFEWAENHPHEARAISEAATAFVRYAGTMEYWERVYDRMFVKRVAPTLEAFVPMDVPVFESEGEEETYDDELAFLELAKDLGFPLKRLFP